VFESPRLRVLDDVAAGERRICPLRLADAFARVFLGIWIVASDQLVVMLVMLVTGGDGRRATRQ
jgi:hypothetical protein